MTLTPQTQLRNYGLSMRKSNRIRSKLLPEHDTPIPDDLPAPSTTRPLLPRLARSGSQSVSGHGSRGSSRSNSSRRSSATGENMTDVDMTSTGVVISGLDPVATSLSNMDEANETGSSILTNSVKRKRSEPDIAFQEPATLGVFLSLSPKLPFFTLYISELSSRPISPNGNPVKGKGKAKESQPQSPDSPEPITIPDVPTSDRKGKNKALHVEQKSKKPKEELLGSYSCPICFSPPTNATLTPCGHICCGLCLFMAVKTTMQRAAMMMAPEGAIAR